MGWLGNEGVDNNWNVSPVSSPVTVLSHLGEFSRVKFTQIRLFRAFFTKVSHAPLEPLVQETSQKFNNLGFVSVSNISNKKRMPQPRYNLLCFSEKMPIMQT